MDDKQRLIKILKNHRSWINKQCEYFSKISSLSFKDLKQVCLNTIFDLEINLEMSNKQITSYIRKSIKYKIYQEIENFGWLIRLPKYIQVKMFKSDKDFEKYKHFRLVDEIDVLSNKDEVFLSNYQRWDFSICGKILTQEEVYQRNEIREIIFRFMEKFMTKKEIDEYKRFYFEGGSNTKGKEIRSNFKRRFQRSKEMKDFLNRYKDLIRKFLR